MGSLGYSILEDKTYKGKHLSLNIWLLKELLLYNYPQYDFPHIYTETKNNISFSAKLKTLSCVLSRYLVFRLEKNKSVSYDSVVNITAK